MDTNAEVGDFGRARNANVSIVVVTVGVRRGRSAYYSHVMPSHPMAKKLLKTKRKTVAVTP